MRKLTLATTLLVAIAVLVLACSSKPPVGPGVVTITETTTSTTTAPPPPAPPVDTVANFEFSPQTPEVLQVVNFDASVSVPGSNPTRTILKYDWDFGDGEQKSGIKTTHDYVVSGVYLVTLQVTDDSGKPPFRKSLPVTVRPVIP